ncbi:MAG: glutamine--fructose-6-phosphate transaminase (isomerizing) [Thermoproteota archaeon]|nr:MAG: glutamine--fructose-6-phosphate transaminase (isomerizing) [Candidatus Korarchaeota archaeon]
MCGIVGCIIQGSSEVAKVLRDALKSLEYRGYDSVGVAVCSEGRITVKKDAGKLEEVDRKLNLRGLKGSVGIGHTRWATHGRPSQENAHPHLDCTGTIAVAHNGIIENYSELRSELTARGHVFRSETDTEVVPHLVEEGLKRGLPLYEAFKQAVSRLEGSYALVMIAASTPSRIYFARKDSPLVLGLAKKACYVCSDIPAILSYTRDIVTLRNYDIGYISVGELWIENLKLKAPVKRAPMRVTWSAEAAQKGGYPHFMLKEIHEQPTALRENSRISREQLEKMAKHVVDADNVLLIAAGTSYHACLAGAIQLLNYLRKPISAMISSEVQFMKPHIDSRTALIAVSQSGETMDTLKAMRYAREMGAKVLSIVNVFGSTIHRESDDTIVMFAGPEIGVAATKTFTAQVHTLSMLAVKAAELSGALDHGEAGKLNMQLREIWKAAGEVIRRSEIKAKSLAEYFARRHSCFYLGRGIGLPTALEGALKMKEIAYVHAEGYPAGESKHGPIALVEEGFPVVFIAPRDETRAKIAGNIEEMSARGAKPIIVCEDGDQLAEYTQPDCAFHIPPGYSPLFSPILYVLPLQLLAYYTAIIRGYDPDKPRNLAKSVTVE